MAGQRSSSGVEPLRGGGAGPRRSAHGPVEVRRSSRRRRTVSAYREGDRPSCSSRPGSPGPRSGTGSTPCWGGSRPGPAPPTERRRARCAGRRAVRALPRRRRPQPRRCGGSQPAEPLGLVHPGRRHDPDLHPAEGDAGLGPRLRPAARAGPSAAHGARRAVLGAARDLPSPRAGPRLPRGVCRRRRRGAGKPALRRARRTRPPTARRRSSERTVGARREEDASAERTNVDADVVVVGAGLAGLRCAGALTARGLSVVVLEQADRPGGRVRTDVVDGLRCDRGFQLLNPSYPAVRRHVDVERPGPAGCRPRGAGGRCLRSGAHGRRPGATP